jgi:hypothetical protein
MRKLITAAVAAAAILMTGAIAGKAEAAPLTGTANLPPLTQSSSPVQNVACWCGPYRCACGYRRGYYRPYGYYGPRRYFGPRRGYYRPYRYRY